MHFRLVPQLFEQSCYDAEVRRNLREHLVGRTVTYGDGEESVCPHYGASSHCFSPCGVLDRLAQVQRREDPGRLLQDTNPILPYLQLFRHLETAEDSLLADNQDGCQGVHPGEHLVRLAYLDNLVPFRQGIGLIFE